jgi:hypothetical protein
VKRNGYIETTPEFWRNVQTKAIRRLKEVQKLTAAGRIGNLLLPKELYEFVSERIASGDCKTPTEVVCAPMPYLRRSRTARQGHVT